MQLSAATSWYFGDGSGVGDFSGLHLAPREYPTSGRINGALGGGTYISGGRTSQFAVKTEPSASRTATIFDAFSYIRFVSPAPAVLTIPHSVSTDFPLGTVIEIEQGGGGELSVAAAPGVTVNSRGSDLTLAGQFAVGALKKVGADTWTLTGDL